MYMSPELLRWAADSDEPSIFLERSEPRPVVVATPRADDVEDLTPPRPKFVSGAAVSPVMRSAATDVSSQSQCVTVPSSPSTNATLRPAQSTQSLQLMRRSSESTLSRTTSQSATSLKTRTLALAASHVVRHIVEVGACGDPQCLMFYDPEVFTTPLSLASRQRMASFRRQPGSGAASNAGNGPDGQQRENDAQSNASYVEELDLGFDLTYISRRLFSSPAQQGTPLQDFLFDALGALSAPSSPLLSTPETFVLALVLLERIQHASLLARQHAMPQQPSPSPRRTLSPNVENGGGLFGLSSGPHLTQSQPSDERIRSFLDETPAVRLTMESLQGLNSTPHGGLRSTTPSATFGQVSDSESIPDHGNTAGSGCHHLTSKHASGGSTNHNQLTMCAECVEQPGLALHASNVHLFFAAAVVVAIKLREDFASGPHVLSHVASMFRCPSVRALCLAERCLCDVLHFNIHVTVHEYRMMLRQLASHRQVATVCGAAQGPVPLPGQAGSGAATGPDTDSAVTSPSGNNNYMSLFAAV